MKSLIASVFFLSCTAQTGTPEQAAIRPSDEPEYTVVATIDPQKPQANTRAVVNITITPSPPWVLKPTTPMKISLGCTEGCLVTKPELTSDDIENRDAEVKQVKTSIRASAGAHTLSGDVSFFLCTEQICKRKSDRVSVSFKAS